MVRGNSVARTETIAISFSLEKDEIARVSGNSDEIASVWNVNAGVDEIVCDPKK